MPERMLRVVLPLFILGLANVATYEEWQGGEGRAARGRLSTVVFTRDDDAPNGLVWRHVHET